MSSDRRRPEMQQNRKHPSRNRPKRLKGHSTGAVNTRIKTACAELEAALDNFEKDDGQVLRAKKVDKLARIQTQLVKIKKQLESLSH